jgi:hypothetical protein
VPQFVAPVTALGLGRPDAEETAMTVKITCDVVFNGKRAKGDIEWEGTREQMLNAMRFVEGRAAAAGVPPEQLVKSVLAYLTTPGPGLRWTEDEEEFRANVVLYGVARLANEYATDMPALSLVDLAEQQDISAKITMRGDTITMELHGAPKRRARRRPRGDG